MQLPRRRWHWQGVLYELGDQAPMTGSFVPTGAQEHQRSPRADESHRLTQGLLIAWRKLDGLLRVPVVDVAKPPIPDVSRTKVASQGGAIPLPRPLGNG